MAKFVSSENLLYVWQKIKTLLTGKVDKVDGKGLSSNDYTSTEKTKLAGIASNAQVNVLEGIQVNGSTVTPTNKIANIDLSNYATKSDVSSVYTAKGSITWANLIAKTDAKVGDVYNVTDKGGANYVCIKANTAGESSWDKLGETISPATTSANGLMSSTDKSKLDGIAAGAEVNVQSDWNATSGDAFIKNKPTIPTNNNQLTNGAGYINKTSSEQITGYKHFKNGFTIGDGSFLVSSSSPDGLPINGGLLSSPNLNEITTSGFYYCTTPTNKPSNEGTVSHAPLLVMSGYMNMMAQIITCNSTVYMRTGTDTSWGSWAKVGEPQELTNAEIDTIFNS